MATAYLNDGNEKIACEGCGKPRSQCTCGCRTCSGGMPNLTINIDSNNKRGYNTLNPGSIERDTMVYPVQPTVVSTPSSNTSYNDVTNKPIGVPDTRKNAYIAPAKKKRVFLPEFL